MPDSLASDNEPRPATGAADHDQLAERLRQATAELAAARDRIASLEKQLRDYPEQLEQKVRERTRELEAVNRIAATVSRSLNLDVILRDSLEKVL